MHKKSAKTYKNLAMLTLMLPLVGGCALLTGELPSPTPIPDACAWLKKDIPDKGFESRWTRNEKEYAESMNRFIDEKCGRQTLEVRDTGIGHVVARADHIF